MEAGPLVPVHGVTWQPEVELVSVASGRLTLRLGRPVGYYAYVRLTTLEWLTTLSGRMDKAMHRARYRYVAVAVFLGVTFGAEPWKPLEAQDPERCRDPRSVCEGFDRFRLNPANSPTWSPQMIRDSGRPIVPIFEGWFQNEDGTYTLSFGYASFNLEEALHIPVGQDNFIEPSEFDGGQPTYFKEIHRFIRRPWNTLMITVPEDFGDQRVVWTLRNHGETYSTPGHITSPHYMIENPIAPARYQQGTASGYAPFMRFDPAEPWVQGLRGTRVGPLAARVGEPLEISVWVDSGETLYERPTSWLYWVHYSGPGNVVFNEDEIQVALTEGEGMGTTTVTFGEPGDYVLLVQSIETLRNSFEYHCCWTNGWVEVTVTN